MALLLVHGAFPSAGRAGCRAGAGIALTAWTARSTVMPLRCLLEWNVAHNEQELNGFPALLLSFLAD